MYPYHCAAVNVTVRSPHEADVLLPVVDPLRRAVVTEDVTRICNS